MAAAESQSQSATPNASGESGFYNAGGGGAGTGTGGSNAPPVLTAEDLAKEKATPAEVPAQPLTLSEQIAANFAALSSIMGNTDQTGGGAYPVPVPVAAPAKSSATIWVIMAAAAVAVWFFFFRKKGNENG
jgi:hypothetical protein